MVEIKHAALVGIEPDSTLFGFTHLLAVARGQQRRCERVRGLLLLAADEIRAVKDIAPLIVPAHLQHAAVAAVQF
ncbi:hypothetical protein SDC9_117478 [bioreactor metagenome]|uniref:Uncharacterized protein n=1 Tax=bioreactor metagenome TaxID=1076179 RepID=A0A645C5A7_9ZZZZ